MLPPSSEHWPQNMRALRRVRLPRIDEQRQPAPPHAREAHGLSCRAGYPSVEPAPRVRFLLRPSAHLRLRLRLLPVRGRGSCRLRHRSRELLLIPPPGPSLPLALNSIIHSLVHIVLFSLPLDIRKPQHLQPSVVLFLQATEAEQDGSIRRPRFGGESAPGDRKGKGRAGGLVAV